MNLDLGNLRISPSEIEAIINLDIFSELQLNLYRGLILRNKAAILTTLLSELFLLLLSLIVIMPLGLMIIRSHFYDYGNDIQQFWIIIVIALVWLLGFNIYLGQQIYRVKSLAKLMESIDKYNSIIHTLDILAQLDNAHHNNNSQINNSKLL